MARISPAAWTVAEVEADRSWTYRLSAAASAELLAAVRAVVQRAGPADKPILDWRREDFALDTSIPMLAAAFREVRDGRGMALVKNLPRAGVSPAEFRLMTWAIGLHFGVARPQNRASDYITEVRDAGMAYRSPTGRGYNSKAELDFHVDSADVVLLSCYNQAPVGGMSLCASAATAFDVVTAERPDYARALRSSRRCNGTQWNISTGCCAGRTTCSACISSRAISRSCATTPCCTRAPASRTILRTRRSAPSTGCGWHRPIRGACPTAGQSSTKPPSPAPCAAA